MQRLTKTEQKFLCDIINEYVAFIERNCERCKHYIISNKSEYLDMELMNNVLNLHIQLHDNNKMCKRLRYKLNYKYITKEETYEIYKRIFG